MKDGRFLKFGEIIKRPVYAETLKTIGESGSADIFYKGKYADTIVKEVDEHGGNMQVDDLKEYRAKDVNPLLTKLGDLKILAAPPPAGGAVLINVLKILQGNECFCCVLNLKSFL